MIESFYKMPLKTDHTVDSAHLNSLRKQLPEFVGSAVLFSNGCYLALVDDGDEFFWGTGPYGLDWGCSVSGDWVGKVVTWLEYWNSDRDERGNIIER